MDLEVQVSNRLPQEALKIEHWNHSLSVCTLCGLGQNRLIGKVEAIILNLQGLVQCAGDPNSGPCSCIESTFTAKPSFQRLTHFLKLDQDKALDKVANGVLSDVSLETWKE